MPNFVKIGQSVRDILIYYAFILYTIYIYYILYCDSLALPDILVDKNRHNTLVYVRVIVSQTCELF